MTSNARALVQDMPFSPLASPVDTAAFGKIPLVKDLIQLHKDAGKGDIEAVSNDIVSYASSDISLALDPITFVTSAGVTFVLDFVAPVRDAIQLVTGDSAALTAGAGKFEHVHAELDQLATALTDTLDNELSTWDGEAADALRTKMAKFIEGVHGTAGQAHNLSELLKMSSAMMEAAEGVLKGILSDFLSWAVTTWVIAAASSAATVGGSIAAATAATGVEAGITCAKAAAEIQKIMRILQRIMDAITAIKAALDTYRIVDSVNKITSGHAGNNGDAKTASKAADYANKANTQAKKLGDTAAAGHKEVAESHGYTVDEKDRVTTIDSDGNITDRDERGFVVRDDNNNPVTHRQSNNYGHNRIGRSATTQAATGLGTAADSLEKQAKQGGFSEVPADKTLSGDLDW